MFEMEPAGTYVDMLQVCCVCTMCCSKAHGRMRVNSGNLLIITVLAR